MIRAFLVVGYSICGGQLLFWLILYCGNKLVLKLTKKVKQDKDRYLLL
jgi:hypothetical protein